MDLNYTDATFTRHTTNMSNIARQLAFAGVAIIWIFVVKKESQVYIPEELVAPLQLFIACLAADLLQYFYGGSAWGLFNAYKEHELYDPSTKTYNKEKVFAGPSFINWPIWGFFFLKSGLVIFGYYLLLLFFVDGHYVNYSLDTKNKKDKEVQQVQIISANELTFRAPALEGELEKIHTSLVELEKSNQSIKSEIKKSNDAHLDRHLKIISQKIDKNNH